MLSNSASATQQNPNPTDLHLGKIFNCVPVHGNNVSMWNGGSTVWAGLSQSAASKELFGRPLKWISFTFWSDSGGRSSEWARSSGRVSNLRRGWAAFGAKQHLMRRDWPRTTAGLKRSACILSAISILAAGFIKLPQPKVVVRTWLHWFILWASRGRGEMQNSTETCYTATGGIILTVFTTAGVKCTKRKERNRYIS